MVGRPHVRVDLQLAGAHRDAWDGLADLSDRIGPQDWAVVGGQMVLLHAAEHGVAGPRVTTDGDLVVDVRAADIDAAARLSSVLVEALDFTLDGPSPDLVGHRFTRAGAVIDVLAPDGLKRSVYTVGTARTVEAPGATQALRRSELVRVALGDRETVVRRPDLVGALIAKAAAADRLVVDRGKHLRDTAFLLTLVARNPMDTRERLEHGDRRRLRAIQTHLVDDRAECWLGLDSHDGINALSFVLAR